MDLKLDSRTIPDGAPVCNLGTLRQVMLFAAQEDSRPVIHSVHVTRTYLEAADGYTACRVWTADPDALATIGVPKGAQGLALYLPDLKALRGKADDPVKIVQVDRRKVDRGTREVIDLAWVAVGRAIWAVRTVDVTLSPGGRYPDVGRIFQLWAKERDRVGPAGEIAIDPVYYPRIQALAKSLRQPKDDWMATYLALAMPNPTDAGGPPPALVAIGGVRGQPRNLEIRGYCLVMPLHYKQDELNQMVTEFGAGKLWEPSDQTEEEPQT